MRSIWNKILGLLGGQSKGFREEFARQLLNLVTSGFGLVAALAWNQLITEVVNVVIKPWTGKFSGIFSLLIYAIIVTILAVVVTFNLTKLAKKNAKESEKGKKKAKKS